jgi:hypothetical protein
VASVGTIRRAVTYFNAPWGPTVWLTTIASSALLAFVSVQSWAKTGIMVNGLLPLLLWGISALFAVRGYTVTRDAILVHRLFWKTRVSRNRLRSAKFEPIAMQHSWRTLGNRGLFAITGWFRNSTLGLYRAYMTDFNRAVVLRYPHSTVVVSPDDPVRFIREVTGATNTLDWSPEQEPATTPDALMHPQHK